MKYALHTKEKPLIKAKELYGFLCQVDELFPVKLSDKTDLKEYAEKLVGKADIQACFYEGRLIGLIAFYTNDTPNDFAYISMTVVLPEFQNRGIAASLLGKVLIHCRKKGLRGIHLYTTRTVVSAMRLYERLGFTEVIFENEPRAKDVHLFFYFQPKTALVTAIGSMSADCVMKNLKAGYYKVVGTDIYPKEWVANSLEVDSFYQVPMVCEEEQFLEKITEICREEKITHILPSTDVDVDFFTKYRAIFEKQYIIIGLSFSKTIEICRDKLKQQELLLQSSMKECAIKTQYLDADMDTPPFDFPIICKPVNGRSSQGLVVINDQNEWKVYLKKHGDEKVIVQPQITGSIVTVDIVRQKNGKKCAAIPREELLRTYNGAGLSVKLLDSERIEKLAVSIAELFDIIGCVNFEFLLNEKEIRFLECNPRFSGGVGFSILAGYDCVKNHMRCFENKEIDEYICQGERFLAKKYKDYVVQ